MKNCVVCHKERHIAKHWNQVFRSTVTTKNMCEFCKNHSMVTSMETVVIDCPLCQGTGTRTWIDIMMRPYNKTNIEKQILDSVILEKVESFKC